MIYPSNMKEIVDAIRDAYDWDDQLIQKYVNYVMKRKRVVNTGRSGHADGTKGRTYKAEWSFQAKCDDQIKKFKTEKQVIAYVKRVTKSKHWQDLTGGKEISVSFINSNRWCGRAWSNRIEISRLCGMDQYTVLHELTHCAGHMHHDVPFRQTLVKMTSRFIGREASKTLKQCFKDQGLKMYRTDKVMMPDEWFASQEKMAKIREKKAA